MAISDVVDNYEKDDAIYGYYLISYRKFDLMQKSKIQLLFSSAMPVIEQLPAVTDDFHSSLPA